MKNKVTYLSTIILSTLAISSGAAHATATTQSSETKPVVKIVQNESFVSIPLITDITINDAAELELELSEDFETDYISKIEYDIFGNMDAKLGLIKSKNVKSRYKTRPAIHPRGRYFKPLNSKLGASVSSKF